MNNKIMKNLIRHFIHEMSLMDVEKPSVFTRKDHDMLVDPQSIKKYLSSSKFKSDAIKYFRLFSTPIYIVPIVTPRRISNTRVTIMRNEEQVRTFLIKFAPDQQAVEKLMLAFGDGAAIIVCESSSLDKGFLPSIWMTVHAMIDDTKPVFVPNKIKK